MKKFLYLDIAFSFLLLPIVFANVDSMYIQMYVKNLETEIIVNKDSSLLITEKFIVYFGDVSNKSSVLRELPTQIKTEEGTIKTLIDVISVTDFNNYILYYKLVNDTLHHVITLTIDHPDKTINSSVKDYKISYLVRNNIIAQNKEFDKLYLNLNGYFRDLPIENFKAVIVFPEEFNLQNIRVDYYNDYFGLKTKDSLKYRLVNNNILEITSSMIIQRGESINLSITLPKGIFASRQLNFFEKYNDYLNYLILSMPLAALILCLYWWLRYGRDPVVKKPVVPEYEPPENLSPIEVGVLMSNGMFTTELFAAGIIYLVANKFITITEIEHRFWGAGIKDYKIQKTEIGKQKSNLDMSDKNIIPEFILLAKLPDEFLLSSLKNKFNKEFLEIQNYVQNSLIEKNIFASKGLKLAKFCFGLVCIIILSLPVIDGVLANALLDMMMFITAFIFFLFALVMSSVTQRGAEILWRIKGFELYMKNVERYRQQFYEQEKIFDKLLPYAMVFGIAPLWLIEISKLYDKGTMLMHSSLYRELNPNSSDVNFDNFADNLNNIFTNIVSTMRVDRNDFNTNHSDKDNGTGKS